MRAGLSYALPADPRKAEQAAERLQDLFELLNTDKEDWAVDPDSFTGNLADYPQWIRDAFADRALVVALEKFCDFDPGELDDWDLDGWYEDLFHCLCWDFKLNKAAKGRWEVTYEVEEEHYGGDMSHAWILLAAGAVDLRALPLRAGPES